MSDLDFQRVAMLDLSRHLDQRMEKLFNDFMDRCCTLEIDYDKATAMALTIISHYASIAATGIHATEAEFVELCRYQYQQGIKLCPINSNNPPRPALYRSA